MTQHFLSRADVARILGGTKARVSQLDMPTPDATVGRFQGWKQETIDEWIKTSRHRAIQAAQNTWRNHDDP